MKIELIGYAVGNLFKRKMRSGLTVLSILIGIMAIFALVSFGIGIKFYVDELASEAGVDKMFIQPKGAGAPGTDQNFFISKEDIDFVRKINGVDKIVGMYMKPGEIKFKKETKYTFLVGIDPKESDFILESFTVEVIKGRDLKNGELSKVVMGYNYQFQEKISKRAMEVGDKFEINGQIFEIVGFFSEVGNPQDDASIYMTNDAIEKLFPETKDKYGMVMMNAQKGENVDDLAEKVQEKLRKFKGEEEDKETFYVQTFADALETFSTVIDIINNVLVLIALVSLIVASVNIMNTMYTAVIERTKEIGIMKAIGARNSDIMFIFLIESGMLGLVGGILGVVVGYLVASAGGAIAAGAGYSLLQPRFPEVLIAGCILFASMVGSVAGILPAVQASKLSPVEALRTE
ncbi:MAG: ABC transporter permease [Nanoarchaeota archaeon]|nr:ABC transporter permease [Nanoarchaeota archaeon]